MLDNEMKAEPPLCAAWRPTGRPKRVIPPAGAWDMHAHLIGPASTQSATRMFTAPEATVHDYIALLDRLGIRHGMIVQPTVQGHDHHILLNGLRAYPSRLLGVAVVDAEMAAAELDVLRDAGVIGVRLFDIYGDGAAMADLESIATLCAERSWFLQLAGPGRLYPLLEARLASLRLPVVIDHLGWVDLTNGATSDILACLLRLVRYDHVYVKLSAPNRLSKQGPPFADIVPLARALIDIAPEQILWGSDWPHIGLPDATPDTEAVFDFLADCTCKARQELILAHNPRKLFRTTKDA